MALPRRIYVGQFYSSIWNPGEMCGRCSGAGCLRVLGTAYASAWLQVRLIPTLQSGTFASVKLRPERANLRGLAFGARNGSPLPSAEYNNQLALESSYGAALELLHSFYARDGTGALREASMLLKANRLPTSVLQPSPLHDAPSCTLAGMGASARHTSNRRTFRLSVESGAIAPAHCAAHLLQHGCLSHVPRDSPVNK